MYAKLSDFRCPGFGANKMQCTNPRGKPFIPNPKEPQRLVTPPEASPLCGECWYLRQRHRIKMWQHGSEIPKV